MSRLITRLRWLLMRPFRRVEALTKGYFWMPCPNCGTKFGGQEWRPGHFLYPEDWLTRNQAICPPCAYARARARRSECRKGDHIIQETWSALTKSVDRREDGTLVVTGAEFDTRLPADQVWCARCLIEFEPLTREPVGWPL